MKKVLMYITTKDLGVGGIERYVLNLSRYLLNANYKVDVVVPCKINASFITDSFKEMGCNLFELNAIWTGPFKFISIFYKTYSFLKSNKYGIIHVHFMTFYVGAVIMLAAKLSNIKKRIIHSHTSNIKSNVFHEIVRLVLKYIIVLNSTDLVACSKFSAIQTYGDKYKDKVIVALAGIDTEKFRYNKDIRYKVRNEFGIRDNEYLIANVARVTKEKNPLFLVELFKEYYRVNNNSVLWFVGDGDEKEQVLKLVSKYKLGDRVKILGMRNDVDKLLQAVDIVISPSIYEGYPISFVEAQNSGLPIIASNNVSNEVDLTGHISFLSLDDDMSKWARCIENYRKNYIREDCSNVIKNSGSDVKDIGKVILDVYNG